MLSSSHLRSPHSTRLAEEIGEPGLLFKQKVRRLKELGLTESLSIGYRLSSRGSELLDCLVPEPPGPE
ncbi:hypothetical protein BH23ACT4_BH23ACT4_13850 [soil metagenome]